MTKEQQFIEQAKIYEDLQDQIDLVRESLVKAMVELGPNKFAQDPETKIVYQVVKPTGTFIYYRDLDYIRTKKESERAGTLSAKKAQEAGFDV